MTLDLLFPTYSRHLTHPSGIIVKMAGKGTCSFLLSHNSLSALIGIGKTNYSTRKKSTATWGQPSGGQLGGWTGHCGQQLWRGSLVTNKANKAKTGRSEKAEAEQEERRGSTCQPQGPTRRPCVYIFSILVPNTDMTIPVGLECLPQQGHFVGCTG